MFLDLFFSLRILFFHHKLWLEMLIYIVIITSHFLHDPHSSFILSDCLFFHLNFLLSSFVSKSSFKVFKLAFLLFSHRIELLHPLLFSFFNNIKVSFLMLFERFPVLYFPSSFQVFKPDIFLRFNFL